MFDWKKVFNKKQKDKIFAFCLLPCAFGLAPAAAYEYGDRHGFKLAGSGTAGALNPTSEKPEFIDDFRVRAQFNYSVSESQSLGAVYALDQVALDENSWERDAFVFMEDSSLGRAEAGLTDSVVRKMGLGLPDVGGLRLNERPVFYKKISPHGPIISNTTLNSGRYVPRLNLTTVPTNALQYGFSGAGLTDEFKYSLDFGLRYRQPEGKTKTSFSLGASFIDKPDEFRADMFTQNVTADWRAQLAAGMNLQYNSWIWGLSARVIYDQNPAGQASDGIFGGTGVSYDFLKYSVSASYLFSDTGVWESAFPDHKVHTGLLSFRYKYSEHVDLWISGGITSDTPFISAAMRINF